MKYFKYIQNKSVLVFFFCSLSTETDTSLLLQFNGSAMHSMISVGTATDPLMIMTILLFSHCQKTEPKSLFLVLACSLWYVCHFITIQKVLFLVTHQFSEEAGKKSGKENECLGKP